MIYSIKYKPELMHENKFLLIDENGNEKIDNITNWDEFIIFILQLTEGEANIMFTKDKDIRIKKAKQFFGFETDIIDSVKLKINEDGYKLVKYPYDLTFIKCFEYNPIRELSEHGFIYIVEINGQMYVGQKHFLQGENWKTYLTSSDEVKMLLRIPQTRKKSKFHIVGVYEDDYILNETENNMILQIWRSGEENSLNYSAYTKNGRVVRKQPYVHREYSYRKRYW